LSGYLLVVLAMISTCVTTMSAWRFGLCCMAGWGYFHGILKAHYVGSGGHFIFDAATIGLYLGFLISKPKEYEWDRVCIVKPWVYLLIGWNLFMALVPVQHYLIQIVGLRGNIFWHPMILVGAMMDRQALKALAYTLSGLNLAALGFGLAEFFIGVDAFVPQNEATEIVFNSVDIAGGHMRIPSIFMNAHSYGGTMVGSMPWLIGELAAQFETNERNKRGKILLTLGMVSACIGVFMAGPKTPIIFLGVIVGYLAISGKMNRALLLAMCLLGLVVGFVITQSERFQRYSELADVDQVIFRLGYSLNLGFFETIEKYPMGYGMGSGGTSIPFFLQHLLTDRIWIENEWARIILEQGVVGLILLTAFFAWLATKRFAKDLPNLLLKGLLRFFSIALFATSFVGVGLFSSLPGTAMFLLGIGYCLSKNESLFKLNPSMEVRKSGWLDSSLPAYQRGLARL